jgi:CRISPR-associated protein Csb2
MVVGNAEILTDEQATQLAAGSAEVWRPVADRGGTPLRVPQQGTLNALMKKHAAFLNRLGPEGFRPVPPLTAFQIVHYRRETDPAPRPVAAFTILKPDASGMRSFEPLRRTRDVAGMLRNAVARTAEAQHWHEGQIATFIHGKTPQGEKPTGNDESPDRFQYLPLPTINHALGRVESIRRVLVAAPPHCQREIIWAQRALAGQELYAENQEQPTGLLTILPKSDWVLQQYIAVAKTWSTVTPVILPGFDDPDHLRGKMNRGCDAATQRKYLARLDARMDYLMRKAFRQAGFAAELVAQLELAWRQAGFRAGVDLAARYLPPKNLDGSPRIHVRVRFPSPVSGPIAVGSGRFRGFGLFAADGR